MSVPDADPLELAFAGHSTNLVELDGVRLVTDPLFRTNLLHLRRQAPPVDIERFTTVDAVLVSHSHLDHLDKRSLKLIPRQTRAIVPSDVVSIFRGLGFDDVTGLSAGESTELGSLTVTATDAVHGGSRMPWNQQAESLGFVIRGSQSVYFAGDTDLFDEMADLAQIDLALLPVWGWGPKLGPGHLDPERAARAAELIGPRVAVPIHWGGYMPAPLAKRRPELLIDPPRDFVRMVGEFAPNVEARLVEPGESTTIEAPGVEA
jgi:L-ascorbate metabolism protein UlaG (beta-lactamase superfamily)